MAVRLASYRLIETGMQSEASNESMSLAAGPFDFGINSPLHSSAYPRLTIGDQDRFGTHR